MKKTLYLFAFLAFSTTLVSCHDDDDNNSGPTSFPFDEQLEGKWHLVTVSGGIEGTIDNYAFNEIVYDFDTETHTVKVMNTNTNETKVDFFDSGTYHYTFEVNTITPESCTQTIVINGTDLGCYSFEANQLTMTQIGDDVYTLNMEREPQVIPFD